MRDLRWLATGFMGLAFLGTVAGCKTGDGAPASQISTYPTQTLGEARDLVAKAQAYPAQSCTSSTTCSPAVAMLLGTTETSAFQCTAFLVASDIMATNSHCIPDDLKIPGSKTYGRIKIVFPQIGRYAKTAMDTSEVISASQLDNTFKNPDFAFVRLSSSLDRPVIRLNHDGLQDNVVYTVEKMDPAQGHGVPEAYLREDRCRVVYGSLAAGGAASLRSAVMALGDCTIVHGNSGSPLLNADGAAVGIIFATLDAAVTDKMLEGARPRLARFDRHESPLAVAASFVCIPSPAADDLPLNPICTQDEPTPTSGKFSTEDRASMQARVVSVIDGLEPSLKWGVVMVQGRGVTEDDQIEANESAQIFLLAPKCVADPTTFLTRHEAHEGGAHGAVPQTVTLPVWTRTAGLDQYLRIEYRLQEASPTFESQLQMQIQLPMSHPTGQLNQNQQISLRISSLALGRSSTPANGPLEKLFASKIGICAESRGGNSQINPPKL